MLIDIAFTKIIWNDRAATYRCSSNVQQYISRSQLRAAHFLMCFVGYKRYVVESQPVEMHVLTSQKWDPGVEV
jgi:hypothetical protein